MNSALDGPRAAVLVPKSRALVAAPLFERGTPIQLKQERKRAGGRELRPGELVIVEPAGLSRGKKGGRQVTQAVGRIVRRIGSPDVPRDVIEALMIERGMTRRFPPEVERHAASAAESADEHARKDLTDLVTFTMDPDEAKDFDDAVSAQRDGDKIRIWVHIADVSAFVRPDDSVDKEAYRRATSTYVPGAVEPMLPEALSNVACSLVPGEPRRTVTVEMVYQGAEVVQASYYRSLIKSDQRLTYGQVDEIFAGRETAKESWGEPLALAREVASRLEAEREQRKALAVESLEPVFEFNAAGAPIDVEHEVQTESHKVIEHLMIAANEQVATYLEEHKRPALFRVHPKPDPESVEMLVKQLASLDVPTPPMPEHFTAQQAEQLVGEISHYVVEHVKRTGHGGKALTSLVLRSLKQATYSPKNLGHSGLRSPRYCHFTSPIRRYPDLVVHRALLAGLGVDDAAPEPRELSDAAEWTSMREREAMAVERRADDISRAFYLKHVLEQSGWKSEAVAGKHTAVSATAAPSKDRRPAGKVVSSRGGPRPGRPDREGSREAARGGPTFKGEVTGLIGGGMFVAFGPDLTFEGMLPLRELKEHMGGYWDLNEFGTSLVDANSGHQIKLGSEVEVAVLAIEPARGRVDLLPVNV